MADDVTALEVDDLDWPTAPARPAGFRQPAPPAGPRPWLPGAALAGGGLALVPPAAKGEPGKRPLEAGLGPPLHKRAAVRADQAAVGSRPCHAAASNRRVTPADQLPCPLSAVALAPQQVPGLCLGVRRTTPSQTDQRPSALAFPGERSEWLPGASMPNQTYIPGPAGVLQRAMSLGCTHLELPSILGLRRSVAPDTSSPRLCDPNFVSGAWALALQSLHLPPVYGKA